ncbi:MAG: hypothetical protein PHH61_06135 [Candidatus Nanoarchaeia archaeon]|nr:hypothetical protein [Candidatus Nanoarchaeia archaeon]
MKKVTKFKSGFWLVVISVFSALTEFFLLPQANLFIPIPYAGLIAILDIIFFGIGVCLMVDNNP